MNRPVGYIDVDRLQAETTLEAAAAKCGVSLDVKGTGAEVRIDCQFGCSGDHGGRKLEDRATSRSASLTLD